MGLSIDLSGVYEKLSDTNMQAGQRALANQALVDMNENFVPMLDGDLRNSATIAIDASNITWNSVYANAQYRGTNGIAQFTNYTTPGTGPYWDLKAKGVFMSDWIHAFTEGVRL